MILIASPLQSRYLWLHLQLGKRSLPFVQISLGRLPQQAPWKYYLRHNSRGLIFAITKSLHHLAYRMKVHAKLLIEMGLDYFRIPAPLLWGRAGSAREMFSTEGIHLWRSEVVDLESFDVLWARRAEDINMDLGKEAYAVYVDEALRDHPDYEIIDFAPPIQGDVFYKSLSAFFDRVEQTTGLKIIIALHPKASYRQDELVELFGERLVASGKTSQLIKEAALVFMHNSTSVSSAVIYRKPIAFLTSAQIDQSWLRSELDVRSSWLNQPVISIDDPTDAEISRLRSNAIDHAAYQKFEINFLRTPNATKGSAICVIANRFETLAQAEA